MALVKFLLAVWKANLQSAMEYRVSFLMQMLGMMLNNLMYFLIWVIFFDRFQEVRGWGLTDMLVTFGITSSTFGLVSILFGNALNLGELITGGRLDYYLSLPKPVLLHALASRSNASGLGDFLYGFLSFAASGLLTAESLARFGLAILFAAAVFLSFLILVQSLAFWVGASTNLVGIAVNAILTFAIYPITLFDAAARLVLFTLIPAALIGALPASFVRLFTWEVLAQLSLGALVLLALAILVFHLGLRRYESGSAIQVEV
ncbi:MAG: ABC-2 family transporter protein [Anaerolineales bacterium]|nr:ABC-2 family transporter protein [Anaerolineales bacterium]